MATKNYCLVTDTRTISIEQALLQIVEINDKMAEEIGVDLTSAGSAHR